VATITTAGDTTVEVASSAGFEIGDVILISEAAKSDIAVIVTKIAGSVLTLNATVGDIFTTAATVTTSSTHRLKTTLTADFVSVSDGTVTQMTIASAVVAQVGQLLLIVDTTVNRTVAEVRVTAINGNVLQVVEVTAQAATYAVADCVVVSVGFNLTYQVDGVVSSESFLTCEPTDLVDYHVNRLAQTEYMRSIIGAGVIDGTATNYRAITYPTSVSSVFMAGGAATSPIAADLEGTNANKPSYAHGLPLFDNVAVLAQFGIPTASAATQRAAIAYAEGRADTFFVCEAEVGDVNAEDLLEYRNVLLNASTSYAGLYAPWLVQPDPLIPGANQSVPPTGHVLGTFSEVSRRRGTQKPPANEILSNVSDVAARITDAEHALLNQSGVCVIRNVEGKGIRIVGARTLWPNDDRKQFTNVRRILNSVKIGFRDFGGNLSFEANDELLWSRITNAGEYFLKTLHGLGWFYPRNKPDDAYFFQCDATTNTEALRTAGKVRAVAGINPVLPGELISFEVVLYSGGGVDVNEL
jgi:phage tail sheath protein FI